MSLIVNLYGGPGTGKSTTAAGLFFLLKNKNINCEYVQEYAKDLVWEDRNAALSCQPYILGKQYHRLFRLKDKVDIIVTDSPILLSLYYNRTGHPELDVLSLALYNDFKNLNIFLKRVKVYNPKGRNQTETEAVVIDSALRDILIFYKLPFIDIIADAEAPAKILREIECQI